MKLLIITQVMDRRNPVLGFFHRWVEKFAKHFERITVICLEKKDFNLSANVRVLSLGKEIKSLRLTYIFRFYFYVWRERKNYDAVFVHMNQEYVLLGGLFWRIWSKKIIFWYNHTHGNFLTKAAMALSHKICHTSPFAFTAAGRNSVKMPAGIDTEFFKNSKVQKIKNSILFIGRISPVKDLRTLISACEKLDAERIDFVLDVAGEAPERDRDYEKKMRKRALFLSRKNKINFLGAVSNQKTPEIFSSHDINVNLTPQGNYDKTVLEAMSCESISLVSSVAFKGVVSQEFFFQEKNSEDLAEKIKWVFGLSSEKKIKYGENLRQAVIKKESLKNLAEKLEGLTGNFPKKS